MIRTYRDRGTRDIALGLNSKAARRTLPPDLHEIARRRLAFLNASRSLDDLRARPGFNLHALRGDRQGQWSIRINDQYRICFVWDSGDAFDVRSQTITESGAKMTKYAGEFPIAVHPGDILQEMLDERGITQMLLAKHLDTDVARINEICRHRRGVSAQMAVLLGKAFGTSADLWLNLQKSWELSQVDPSVGKKVRPLRLSA